MGSGTRSRFGLHAAIAAGLALLLVAAKPPHSEGARPAAGRMLVATQQVGGPFFSQSVVLLLEHGDDGAAGLILNRPSTLVLATLLPELADVRLGDGRVHVGGPVSLETLLLLFRSDAETPPPASRSVLANVWVGGGDETLRYLRARNAAVDEVRSYLGYAGWAAGQLEHEIARGDWVIVPGRSELVFHERPETLWPELIEKHGGIWAIQNPPARNRQPQARARLDAADREVP